MIKYLKYWIVRLFTKKKKFNKLQCLDTGFITAVVPSTSSLKIAKELKSLSDNSSLTSEEADGLFRKFADDYQVGVLNSHPNTIITSKYLKPND